MRISLSKPRKSNAALENLTEKVRKSNQVPKSSYLIKRILTANIRV